MMYKNSQSGFSLVETLVAITILLIVIVGPLRITSQSAKSSSFAAEQVTAFFLAQEGIEVIQKVRDEYFLEYIRNQAGDTDDPWGDFLTTISDCLEADGCGVELDNVGDFQSIDCTVAADACRLYLDTGTTFNRSRFTFDDASGNNEITSFTREVFITEEDYGEPKNREVRIVSRVTWRSGNIVEEQEVQVETRLLNIYAKN